MTTTPRRSSHGTGTATDSDAHNDIPPQQSQTSTGPTRADDMLSEESFERIYRSRPNPGTIRRRSRLHAKTHETTATLESPGGTDAP